VKEVEGVGYVLVMLGDFVEMFVRSCTSDHEGRRPRKQGGKYDDVSFCKERQMERR